MPTVKELQETVARLEAELEALKEAPAPAGRAGRKLTDDQVREMRRDWINRENFKNGVVGIARKYGVSQMLVRNICQYGSVYRDVV